MKNVACIIGAGYSFVGGLPLTYELFKIEPIIVSRQQWQNFNDVWGYYADWENENPYKKPEEFLTHLYSESSKRGVALFNMAVQLLAAVLATPRDINPNLVNPRYGERIIRPSRCQEHINFWKVIYENFILTSIITTNYDLLIERAIRHRPMQRGFGPGFYYGGFVRPQILKGTALPFSVNNQQTLIELNGLLPIYKLHGSLTWALEDDNILMYQDMRPAFRLKNQAALIPPLQEKEVPSWLSAVWKEAENQLSNVESWIVCGYSLPAYDIAIRDLFIKAAKINNLKAIYILDPNSHDLKSNYQAIAPNVEIFCLDGLPQGVQDLHEVFGIK